MHFFMKGHVQLLSTRERKILELLAEGYTDNIISNLIKVPEPTIKKHISNMLQKQGFDNHFQLINWAYRESIIT